MKGKQSNGQRAGAKLMRRNATAEQSLDGDVCSWGGVGGAGRRAAVTLSRCGESGTKAPRASKGGGSVDWKLDEDAEVRRKHHLGFKTALGRGSGTMLCEESSWLGEE